MPIDPVTGEQLPYGPAGEPAPMPPAGEGMPPAEEMPPPGPQEAQIQELAAQAPEPEKPFSKKAIETMVKEFNETLDKLGGGDLPDVEVDLSVTDGQKWEQPLPGDIFIGLVALNEALKMVEEGKFADKYGFDPMELTTDVSLRKATAQLNRMGKDKKLAKAMQEPLSPEETTELGPPPAPGQMGVEDEELAANMA